MTDTPPILPRRPKTPCVTDKSELATSPPISLETKVPLCSLSFKAPRASPVEPACPREASLPMDTCGVASLSSAFISEEVPPNFTNPIYLLMDDRLSPPCPPSKMERGSNFSDTDSIMFLKRNRPKLQRQKSEEVPSSPLLPPPRFPHIYEDVPENMLEKNRELAATRDAFRDISFGSPLTSQLSKESGSESSSPSSNSLYDVPREPSEQKRDTSAFWIQPQLSMSGVFYEFPAVRSPPVKGETIPQTCDSPSSTEREPSVTDTDVDKNSQTCSASYEVPPPPVPVPSIQNSSPIVGRSPKSSESHIIPDLTCSPKRDPAMVFAMNCLYEVPKPFRKPCVSSPENPFSFPDTSDLYDVPPQRGAPFSSSGSPPSGNFSDGLSQLMSDDLDEEDIPLLSPPPPYPPPPPPDMKPPAIPPRTYLSSTPPATPKLSEKDKSHFPVPAVRTSLSKRLQANRIVTVTTPSAVSEKDADGPHNSSTFYRAFPAGHFSLSSSLTSSAEQSPTFSLRSTSSKSHSPVPDSPRLDCFFDGKPFLDPSAQNLARQESEKSAASDSSSLNSEDCWTGEDRKSVV